MKHDLAIIGGGPAGMMTAITAARSGAKVILIEKNSRLGKKLLITGKSRCNITNATENTRHFIDQLGKKGKFLYSAINRFSIEDILDLFHKNGLDTKVERGQRIFPVSDKASDVLEVLERLLNKHDVEIINNCTVLDIIAENNRIIKLKTSAGEFSANNYVIATGGLSYPGTGSTGDGYRFAKALGHMIIEPRPSLVGLKLDEDWIDQTPAVELKNINVSIYQNNKKRDERFGEALFTHVGISGPIVLDMSKHVAQLLSKGAVELRIDFKPALSHQQLDQRILRDLQEMNNREFQRSLDKLLPRRLRPIFVGLSKIDPCKKANSITREERKIILHLLKEFKLKVTGLEPIEKAIITAGGIDLKEIDSNTMRSKIIDNLYFAGEVIDLDGPTGGYNLQICWSTGHSAGMASSPE